MRTRVFFSILLSVLLLSSVTAQKSSNKITITGTVLDGSENPVVNAMIMIDGVKSSSMTDSKGMYKIKVKRTAQKIGIISFGSGLIEEAINGRTEINFKFSASSLQQQPDQPVSPGEEGVNTGYNYVKKKDMTSPANKIDGTDKKYASYSSVSEMITRETSGVKYTGSSYIIQDSKDFFGSVPALLVVDGVYVDTFDGISPSSVESITVLKGSSAAIYGARGYGGAIVLKTKIQNK
jgi:TonB-dependent SusC/RagA subfamily outer membrane receptor